MYELSMMMTMRKMKKRIKDKGAIPIKTMDWYKRILTRVQDK